MNEELDLLDLFYFFWKKKIIIIVSVLIGIVMGIIYTSFVVVPKYTSSVMFILSKPTSVISSNQVVDLEGITQSDILLNQKLISTYGEIMKSRSISNTVIDNLKLDMNYDEITKCINVASVKDTDVIKLTITTVDPELSAKIANEMIKVFSDEIVKIYNIQNISIIDSAEIDRNPINVSYVKNIAIFTILVLVIVCAIIFLLYYFDNTVKTKEDVDRTVGIPVLALIPMVEAEKKDKKRSEK